MKKSHRPVHFHTAAHGGREKQKRFYELRGPVDILKDAEARVARAVAYTFLTYPCVTESGATLTSAGQSSYFEQLDVICKLVGRPPTKREICYAYAVYVKFGWLNPLVVSQQVRSDVSKQEGPLYTLLRLRLLGEDAGSLRVIDTLKRFAVG